MNQRTIEAHDNLDIPIKYSDGMCFILQGYACQYVDLPNGSRQIVAILMPGDECFASRSPYAEHPIRTLTEVTISEAAAPAVAALLQRHPAVADALWQADLVTQATLCERLTSLGRRSARERLAHLLCEFFLRSEAVGLTTGDQCAFPFSQTDIADVLGLSLVHVNRLLQALRASNLIRLESRLLTVIDFPRLKSVGQFDAQYLRPRPQMTKRGFSSRVPPAPEPTPYSREATAPMGFPRVAGAT